MSKTISIPNELKINIHTSIPGFQNFRYKPEMTIPSLKDEKSVYFNPLIKLKQSIIDKVPEQFRQKEFFDKGLFYSLISLHGLQKKSKIQKTLENLERATEDGDIDNNIQITLDNLH